MEPSNYEKQANDFLAATNTELIVEFDRIGKHFDDDKDQRCIWNVTLKRGQRSYTFNFGSSIANLERELNKGHVKPNLVSFSGHRTTWNEWQIKERIAKLQKNPSSIEKPTAYGILACLQKYDPGTHENFCAEFGYDVDSIKALKTYEAVVKAYTALCTLYTDTELDLLRKIN